MTRTVSLLVLLVATSAFAQETRQLEAHRHGVGSLNVAVEGTTVLMELRAPGADIVGFEYAAQSEVDRAAVDTAVAKLATPLDLFISPANAECSVTQANAELESEVARSEHDEHEDHGEHSDHAEDKERADEARHSEFHAEYTLSCAKPEALTKISFAYFDIFENAHELEVQIITTSGARAFKVERNAPELDLRSLF